MEDVDSLNSLDAESIIDSFRQGTVPAIHPELYLLGRNRNYLSAVARDFERTKLGNSKVRFLAAPWGGGKTHLLTIAKQKALESNLVVSYVELHSREAPFDKFEVIFHKILKNIALRDGNGIEYMLENWAKKFPFYEAQEVDRELRRISPSLDFRSALRATLHYANTNSPDHRRYLQGIVAWLQGARVVSEVSKTAGIKSNITIDNVSEIFRSFLNFIHECKYGGLVLLLDEAEAITSLSQSQRRKDANQNIRKLLDNADNNRGIYILFSTTLEFLNNKETGAQSYPALWTRIRNMTGHGEQFQTTKSVILNLPPLDKEILGELAFLVINTHEVAYGWDAKEKFKPDYKHLYISQFLQKGDIRMIRTFIKGLVYTLDIANEQSDVDIKEVIEGIAFESEMD
ncbi:BREX system ATP-binding domain-containing protein [Bacteroidota bacterium]